MRGSLWTGLLCAAVACFALGCSERPQQSEDEADQELAALAERTRGLREGLTDTLRPELRAEFETLVADVEEWRARTGRPDIRTGTDSIRGPATEAVARDDGGGGGDDSCASCPGYRLDGDRICFLEEEGSCPDPEDEIFAGRVCVYQCIWIGSGAEPAGRGEAKE